MTVRSVETDPEALTMVCTVDLAASLERVWELWSDPRQLERWWGPPDWPATFITLDLTVGGESRFVMTGPDGDKVGGHWTALSVDAPHGFSVEDRFADGEGNPDPEIAPMLMTVAMTPADAGTTMVITSAFASLADMEQVLAMGVVEGMTAALAQIEAVLAS